MGDGAKGEKNFLTGSGLNHQVTHSTGPLKVTLKKVMTSAPNLGSLWSEILV